MDRGFPKDKMKVLHLSTFNNEGGAAIAAGRLHKNLLERNIDSKMVSSCITGNTVKVIQCGGVGKIGKLIAKIRPYIDRIPLFIYIKNIKTPWSVAWLPNKLDKIIRDFDPDIVHVHWIGNGFISLSNISSIKAKIVWTLHDSWPFTGGCHVIQNCKSYLRKCGKCPQLGSNFSSDLSRIGWYRKANLCKSKTPLFIAPSKWMHQQAKSSSLLSDSNIEVIPNGLNISVFQPHEKQLAREILGLPKDKKIIMFGAMNATSDPNKGFTKLKEVLSILKEEEKHREKIILVIFGATEPDEKPELYFETIYLGRIYDEISLAVVYSAADIMCIPSLQESFCQTATESMACGTPVVAFFTSGLIDIVEHNISGYLAKSYDSGDFAHGVMKLLNNPLFLRKASESARVRAEHRFNISSVTTKYLQLYKKLLQDSNDA